MRGCWAAPMRARRPVRTLSAMTGRADGDRSASSPMETLDLLEELVAGFDGTVLLVSHDRDFLDRTVNAVIAPDPDRDGRWIAYAGGYSDMNRC